MKIEEVIKIYEFLGKLSVFAFIGITLLILVAILMVILPLRDKVVSFRSNIILLETLVLISLIGLYIEARARNKYLSMANATKSTFVSTGHTKKTFNQIIKINYMDSTEETFDDLRALPEQFPTEFVLIHFNGKTTADSMGLRITDPAALTAIQKKLDEKAEVSSLHIRNYMLANKVDTVYTSLEGMPLSSLIRYIDNEGFLIGQDFFRALVGKNGLTAIYDTNFWYHEGGFHISAFHLTEEKK